MNDDAFVTAGLKHYAEAITTVEQFEETLQVLIEAFLSNSHHAAFSAGTVGRRITRGAHINGSEAGIYCSIKGRLHNNEDNALTLGVWWGKNGPFVFSGFDKTTDWMREKLRPVRDERICVRALPEYVHFALPVCTAEDLRHALPTVLEAVLDATLALAPK